MSKRLGLLLALSITSAIVHADNIKLGEPAYGGTGCPAGSVGVAVSPDQQSVSMIFDEFVVEAGGRRTLDRKSCNIAIPIHVPQGYSFSIFAIDYRGFTSLPFGSMAQLNVNYFLAGDRNGVRTQMTLRGPKQDEYLKRDSLGLSAEVWTPCGANTILRANSSMLVRTNSRGDQALATVDSADINAGIVYHLKWRRCR